MDIYVYDTRKPCDTIGAALKLGGADVNTHNPDDLKKAMQLLVAAKQSRSKLQQPVPPMTKPGAAQPASAAQAEQQKQLSSRLRKTGSDQDAAALLLSRMQR